MSCAFDGLTSRSSTSARRFASTNVRYAGWSAATVIRLAFVSIRPWIGPGVQLLLDDADDPTPYWVISSRHPERVVKVLNEPNRPS